MSDHVTVSLLLFAKARELVGSSRVSLTVPSTISTYPQIVAFIKTEFPVLKRLGDTFVLSHNENYIEQTSEIRLAPGDELAIIPPISGG